MLACKKKIFNKFFIFSILFLIFSFCCHAGGIVASGKDTQVKKACKDSRRVQTQQTTNDPKFSKIESDIQTLQSEIKNIRDNNNEILRVVGRLEGKLDK